MLTVALDLLKLSPSALSMVCDTRKGKKKSNFFLWFTAQSGVWGWLKGIGMKNGFEELSNEMGHYKGELGELNVEIRGED